MITLVCSAQPRPSVQKGTKGHQWWTREVHHVSDGNGKTLCGRDSSEWLTMFDTEPAAALEDRNLCTRCAAKLKKQN